VNAGGAGQVAGGPVFGGHREDVTAGAKHGAAAIRRQIHGGDLLVDRSQAAAAGDEILVDLDGDAIDLVSFQVQSMNVSAILEYDGRIPQRRELHIEFGEPCQGLHLAGFQMMHVQVHPLLVIPV
jgi:hypothetical protein